MSAVGCGRLQEEVQAAHAAIGQREKQLQATLDLQQQRHQAELEVKAKVREGGQQQG